ncbi:hypothetical protein ACFL52_02930 [Candidatus Margulisiibacteriota bacterium]
MKKRVNAQILRNTFAVRLFSKEISTENASIILGITDSESINRYIQAGKQPPAITDKSEPRLSVAGLEELDTRSPINKFFSRAFSTKPKIAKKVSDIKIFY